MHPTAPPARALFEGTPTTPAADRDGADTPTPTPAPRAPAHDDTAVLLPASHLRKRSSHEQRQLGGAAAAAAAAAAAPPKRGAVPRAAPARSCCGGCGAWRVSALVALVVGLLAGEGYALVYAWPRPLALSAQRLVVTAVEAPPGGAAPPRMALAGELRVTLANPGAVLPLAVRGLSVDVFHPDGLGRDVVPLAILRAPDDGVVVPPRGAAMIRLPVALNSTAAHEAPASGAAAGPYHLAACAALLRAALPCTLLLRLQGAGVVTVGAGGPWGDAGGWASLPLRSEWTAAVFAADAEVERSALYSGDAGG